MGKFPNSIGLYHILRIEGLDEYFFARYATTDGVAGLTSCYTFIDRDFSTWTSGISCSQR